MTRYLISFDDGAMTFPEEELPDVAKAAREVVQEAKGAGVWVFGGGLKGHEVSVVATDGIVTDGPYPESKEHLGGFAVVDVLRVRRRWSGLPRSPSPAAVRKMYVSSCPTRPFNRRTRGSDPGSGDPRKTPKRLFSENRRGTGKTGHQSRRRATIRGRKQVSVVQHVPVRAAWLVPQATRVLRAGQAWARMSRCMASASHASYLGSFQSPLVTYM